MQPYRATAYDKSGMISRAFGFRLLTGNEVLLEHLSCPTVGLNSLKVVGVHGVVGSKTVVVVVRMNKRVREVHECNTRRRKRWHRGCIGREY